MELDTRTLEGLSLCGDSGPLSDKNYEKLVQLAFLVACREIESSVEAETIASISSDTLAVKQVYAGLLTLAFEASRHDARERDILSLLEDRVSKERIDSFVTIYDKYKLKVRDILSRSSISFPNIVDIKWRLDYFVQSNLIEHNRTLLYLVSLTTRETDGSLKLVEFRATLEDLQDLLTNCKDALNAVKSITL